MLASLEATPLPEWESKTAALAERVTRALLEAQKRLEPTARAGLPADCQPQDGGGRGRLPRQGPRPDPGAHRGGRPRGALRSRG